MDPDAALEQLHAAAEEWRAAIAEGSARAERLAAGEAIAAALALDEWLCRGGYLPAPWATNRTH